MFTQNKQAFYYSIAKKKNNAKVEMNTGVQISQFDKHNTNAIALLSTEIALLPDHGGELNKTDNVQNSVDTNGSDDVCARLGHHFMCAEQDKVGAENEADSPGGSGA